MAGRGERDNFLRGGRQRMELIQNKIFDYYNCSIVSINVSA